jgi:LuxR family transcriptional regulator, maltose regulon positive regulatory protein
MNQQFAVTPAYRSDPHSRRPQAPHTPRGPHGDPLLSAKLLIPPLPPAYVARGRLSDLLTRASRARLTVVQGPAGSGKTVVTSAWVRSGRAPGPVAWLALDVEDNAPGVFWWYVLRAIERAVPELDACIEPPTQAHTVQRSFLTRLATSLADRSEPVVLVLDHAEHITNRAIPADLDLLLQYSTPGLRLVVVGRNARLLPLYRYQLTGELTEVDGDDLALTRTETAAILDARGVRLSDEGLAALHDGTGGWMTGVCLHAMSLRSDGTDCLLVPGPARPQEVTEFLRAEVLDPQPVRVRDLLLRTSIVEEIHPDLADQLTGRSDARGILDDLVRANVFVQALNGSCFRCQPLFRGMLNDELHTRHPHLYRRLHGQAARWYAERQRFAEALRHAVKAGDWAFGADVAVTRLGVAWLLSAPEAAALRAILADLPDTEGGACPALLRATLALARFDTVTARTAVEQAAESAGQGLDERSVALHIGVCTARVILGRLTGDLDAAESAATELDALWRLLPPEEPGDQARCRALVLASLGAVQFWAGRYQAARATLGRAAAMTEPGTEYGVHDALGHLALLDVYDGKLHRADKYARESLAVADRTGLRPAARVGAASAALAAVALFWNDLPAVREQLSRVILTAGSRFDPPTAAAIALLRVRVAAGRLDGRRALASVETARGCVRRWRVYADVRDLIEVAAFGAHLLLGDIAGARRCLDAVSDSPERTLSRGMLYIAEGQPKKARAVLSTLSKRHSRPAVLLYAALAVGRLAFAEGDNAAAAHSLREALDHGRPEQLRRPFVEAGAWVRQVLRQYPDLAARYAWLYPQAGTPRAEETHVIEPLTEREGEVLSRLAQALSTEDIAESLYLSVNTVKTHLKSIYRKLGTSGRSATARRARELKLLPVPEPDDT